MGDGLKRAFAATAATRIKPKRNAVIVDYIKDGDKIIKTVRIECKDDDLCGHLQAEAHRIHYAITN